MPDFFYHKFASNFLNAIFYSLQCRGLINNKMKLLNSLLAGIFFLGIVTANAADVVDTAVKAGKFEALVEPAGLFDDLIPR